MLYCNYPVISYHRLPVTFSSRQSLFTVKPSAAEKHRTKQFIQFIKKMYLIQANVSLFCSHTMTSLFFGQKSLPIFGRDR